MSKFFRGYVESVVRHFYICKYVLQILLTDMFLACLYRLPSQLQVVFPNFIFVNHTFLTNRVIRLSSIGPTEENKLFKIDQSKMSLNLGIIGGRENFQTLLGVGLVILKF